MEVTTAAVHVKNRSEETVNDQKNRSLGMYFSFVEVNLNNDKNVICARFYLDENI